MKIEIKVYPPPSSVSAERRLNNVNKDEVKVKLDVKDVVSTHQQGKKRSDGKPGPIVILMKRRKLRAVRMQY